MKQVIHACIYIVSLLIVFIISKRKRKEIEKDLHMHEIFYDLLHEITKTEKEDEVAQLILKAAIDSLKKGERGSILDISDPNQVQYSAVSGFDKEVLSKVNFKLKDTYLYNETNGRLDKTVIISDSLEYNKKLHNGKRLLKLIEADTGSIMSTICTPVTVDGQVVGMINVDSLEANAFSEKDVKIIEIFSHEASRMLMIKQMMEENLYLSRYDSMTQIYNRGYFYELHKTMYGDPTIDNYLFVATDIDNLKDVNDTYGHMVGDEIIKQFTKAVSEYIDDTVVFGRYGGDEFNLLMPDVEVAKGEAMMKKIQSFLETHPIYEEDKAIYVEFSFGIASYPEDTRNYKELIKLGDQKMYKCKNEQKMNESI